MIGKSLLLGLTSTLIVAPPTTLTTSILKYEKLNSKDDQDQTKNSFVYGANIIKEYITNFINIYDINENTKEDKVLRYWKIYQNNNLFYAYENKIEHKWWWFQYWRWYLTWDGLLNVLSETGDALKNKIIANIEDGQQGLKLAKLITEYISPGLISYITTALSGLPIAGITAIIVGAVTLFVGSITTAIAIHRLWESPTKEKGIVLAFWSYQLVNSWKQ